MLELIAAPVEVALVATTIGHLRMNRVNPAVIITITLKCVACLAAKHWTLVVPVAEATNRQILPAMITAYGQTSQEMAALGMTIILTSVECMIKSMVMAHMTPAVLVVKTNSATTIGHTLTIMVWTVLRTDSYRVNAVNMVQVL